MPEAVGSDRSDGVRFVSLSELGLSATERREAVARAAEMKRAEIRARRSDGSRQVLRLMSDHGASPVWAAGNVPIAWLELSPALERDILAWDALFQSWFDPFERWTDDTARAEYALLAPRLQVRLAAEVADFAVVELDLWPIAARDEKPSRSEPSHPVTPAPSRSDPRRRRSDA